MRAAGSRRPTSARRASTIGSSLSRVLADQRRLDRPANTGSLPGGGPSRPAPPPWTGFTSFRSASGRLRSVRFPRSRPSPSGGGHVVFDVRTRISTISGSASPGQPRPAKSPERGRSKSDGPFISRIRSISAQTSSGAAACGFTQRAGAGVRSGGAAARLGLGLQAAPDSRRPRSLPDQHGSSQGAPRCYHA